IIMIFSRESDLLGTGPNYNNLSLICSPASSRRSRIHIRLSRPQRAPTASIVPCLHHESTVLSSRFLAS
uniref:Uncharacterized protein n=1 Tax=Scleropages formosus TaxID=113540 RepID=A0A8C9SJF5_SCLFO